MAISQSSLFSKFRQKMRDPNGKIWPDAQLLDIANRSLFRIESEIQYHWPDNVATNDTISLVSGTAEYALPTDFGEYDIITIGTNVLDSRDEMPYEQFVRLTTSASSSTPSMFYLRGTNIGFYPIPDGVESSAVLRYRKTVGEIVMEDADIPFADSFLPLILDVMAAEASGDLSGPQFAQEAFRHEAQYQKRLNQFKLRFITRNPRGLNFKTKRRSSAFRQRTDNVIFM
jgi:hypothetical protein